MSLHDCLKRFERNGERVLYFPRPPDQSSPDHASASCFIMWRPSHRDVRRPSSPCSIWLSFSFLSSKIPHILIVRARAQVFTTFLTSAPAAPRLQGRPRGFYRNFTCYGVYRFFTTRFNIFFTTRFLQSFYKCNNYTVTSCFGVLRLLNVFGREQKFH